MPAVQEQDQDIASAHTVRGEVAVPRVGLNEHCSKDVHEEIWRDGPIGWSHARSAAVCPCLVMRISAFLQRMSLCKVLAALRAASGSGDRSGVHCMGRSSVAPPTA